MPALWGSAMKQILLDRLQQQIEAAKTQGRGDLVELFIKAAARLIGRG